jgi:seryl-tRNA synthetase
MEISVDSMSEIVHNSHIMSAALETEIAILKVRVQDLRDQRENDRKEFIESIAATANSRKEMHKKIDDNNHAIGHLELKLTKQISEVRDTILSAVLPIKTESVNKENVNLRLIINWVFKIVGGITIMWLTVRMGLK